MDGEGRKRLMLLAAALTAVRQSARHQGLPATQEWAERALEGVEDALYPEYAGEGLARELERVVRQAGEVWEWARDHDPSLAEFAGWVEMTARVFVEFTGDGVSDAGDRR